MPATDLTVLFTTEGKGLELRTRNQMTVRSDRGKFDPKDHRNRVVTVSKLEKRVSTLWGG